jgi:alpha-beta hydrolase superfamily lysophospholipase
MTTETSTTSAVDTIVLIHGLWMTSRSWEHWVPYLENQGYKVLTPTYPGFEGEVEALRADPSPIAALTITQTVDHLESIIRGLSTPPILIGHSFGGTLIQLLLARGVGAAGVVIDSAPTEGILTLPLSQIRATFPVLSNPANRHKAVGFTPEQFHYAFTNTMSKEESDAVYERYHIAAPGGVVWAGVLANFTPGHQAAWVDYAAQRAPLLFIASGEDHIMPPAVNKSNAEKYAKSPAVTDYHEFPARDHFTCGAAGWEEVADYALAWAAEHAMVQSGATVEVA